jgi:type I site-specific restriction-modification system R (restriction) subunit
MNPNTHETQIQNNTIDLLKNMGYTYLSPEEMTKHRRSTRQVILKDILLKQFQKCKEQKRGLMQGLLSGGAMVRV